MEMCVGWWCGRVSLLAVTATRLYVFRSVSYVVVLDLTASSIEMGFLLARHRIAEVGESRAGGWMPCAPPPCPVELGMLGEQSRPPPVINRLVPRAPSRHCVLRRSRHANNVTAPIDLHKRPSNRVAARSASQSYSRFPPPPDQGITRPANQRDIGERVACTPRGLCIQHHARHPGRRRSWRVIAIAGSQCVRARRHATMRR